MLFGKDTKGLKFNEKGLLPAIIQDWNTRKVLMYVFMNKEAVRRTRKSKELWLFNRSKNKVWKKGNHSGKYMKVMNMYLHHDGDVLLVEVQSKGAACHLGKESCFDHSYLNSPAQAMPKVEKKESEVDEGLNALRELFADQNILDEVEVVTADVEDKPSNKMANSEKRQAGTPSSKADFFEGVYQHILDKIHSRTTADLATEKGDEKIAQRVGEKAMQLMLSVTQHNRQNIVKTEAEIMYSLLELMAGNGIELEELRTELKGFNRTKID